METTIFYVMGHIRVILGLYGIMEKKMETTILYIMGHIRVMLGLYWDNGKENGNHYIMYNGLY